MQEWPKSAVAILSLWVSLVAAHAVEPGNPPRDQDRAWHAARDANDMRSQRMPGFLKVNQPARSVEYRADPPPDTGPGPTDPNGPSP